MIIAELRYMYVRVRAHTHARTHTHTHRERSSLCMPVKTSVIILKKICSESKRSIHEDRMYPMSVRNEFKAITFFFPHDNSM